MLLYLWWFIMGEIIEATYNFLDSLDNSDIIKNIIIYNNLLLYNIIFIYK